MSAKQDPWTALKPPASDIVTYLTFIETNLKEENLPKLHEILQDAELNQAIGWDLVHLLLPFVPAADECLLDIAKLGNPREVVLKASEGLRILELDGIEVNSQVGDFVHVLGTADKLGSLKRADQQTPVAESSKAVQQPATDDNGAELPIPVLQFRILLSMLSILHPRIKTEYPSRFLSSTLQAVLATFSEASVFQDEMTEDVVKLVKAVSGTKRPIIPSRRSSSKLLLTALSNTAPDPEAQSAEPSAEERAMQQSLLQSFLTHILEGYMLSLSSVDDVPGMAWSARLQEKSDPGHVPPHKTSITEQTSKSESFQNRLATIGSIVALAQDLGISSHKLFEAVLDPTPEPAGNEKTEDEPPLSPADIPFSKPGALFLLTARKSAETFYNRPVRTPTLSIFPEHAAIVNNFLGGNSRAAMGLEPEPLIDTILFLGLLALNDNAIGEPASDEAFNEYLQNISLLSANSPSPSLRYQAHYLCTTVLRSHPHDLARLLFIRDTLEYCPYENLKTSAVSWIKGETIEANPFRGPSSASNSEQPSIFATPVALSTLSPYLFPDLTERLTAPSLRESYVQFQADLSFYLAALNFYYLLLKAKHLHEPLDIRGLSQQNDIGGNYLYPLKEAAGRYKNGLKEGGDLFEGQEDVSASMELGLLEDTIARIEEGIRGLNVTTTAAIMT